jgi:hypothetical protein
MSMRTLRSRGLGSRLRSLHMITIYYINKYAGPSDGVKRDLSFGAQSPAPARLHGTAPNLFLTIIIMCGKRNSVSAKDGGRETATLLPPNLLQTTMQHIIDTAKPPRATKVTATSKWLSPASLRALATVAGEGTAGLSRVNRAIGAPR